MYHRPGMTVEPVYAEDESGAPIVQDFEINGGSYTDRNWQEDFIEDSEGNVRHVMQEVELTDESNEGGYDQAEYYDALFDEYPALNSAIDWAAAGGMDAEFVQHFNEATAAGDLDQVHEFIELLLKDYEQFGEEVEPEEDETTTDELTPEEEGQLEEFVSELLSNEPEGEEVAEGWQDQVATAQESGDEAWALVCAANAAYHAGEVDAQDAITYVLNEISTADIRRIGSYLSGY